MDKIHHIAIQVDNIEDAVDFYLNQFDCKVDYEDETWAVLKFENIKLALVTSEEHPTHFAVESKLDGIKLKDVVIHRDGTEGVYIEDNSGNVIELINIKDPLEMPWDELKMPWEEFENPIKTI